MVLGLGKSRTEKNQEWSDKGENYYEMGQYEKAIECFSKAISFDPKDYVSFNGKGIALLRLGNFEESIKQFDEAIRINSTFSVIWYHKGKSFYYLKKYKKAIECFNQAIRINPKNSDAWYLKAMSFYNLEENEEFMRCSKKLQSIDSDIDPDYEDQIQKKIGEIKLKSPQVKENEKLKPLNVLKMRLAKGEISLDEFNELKDIL
jgi:tetratricopeptide (TPR) repeat protein